MNSELSKILADCIADMERGAAVDDCLKRNPGLESELRPHLETWAAIGAPALVQPPAAAFDHGLAAMLAALKPVPGGLGPLSAVRFAPAWATVTAAAAAVVILLGGAAGTSAALGGPDPTAGVLSAVGVNRDDSAVDDSEGDAAGLQSEDACEDANRGHGNDPDHDDGDNPGQGEGNHGAVEDATNDECAVVESNQDGCEDANRGHGNDPDHDDEDNPGQGEGNHGADADATPIECTPPTGDTAVDGAADENKGHGNDADHDDEDNPGQGQGNHGTGNNGTNGNAGEDPGGNGNGGNPEANGNGGNPENNGNGGNGPQGQGIGPKNE
jgi:hypothetical protein